MASGLQRVPDFARSGSRRDIFCQSLFVRQTGGPFTSECVANKPILYNHTRCDFWPHSLNQSDTFVFESVYWALKKKLSRLFFVTQHGLIVWHILGRSRVSTSQWHNTKRKWDSNVFTLTNLLPMNPKKCHLWHRLFHVQLFVHERKRKICSPRIRH